jgi:hypothetical protein
MSGRTASAAALRAANAEHHFDRRANANSKQISYSTIVRHRGLAQHNDVLSTPIECVTRTTTVALFIVVRRSGLLPLQWQREEIRATRMQDTPVLLAAGRRQNC